MIVSTPEAPYYAVIFTSYANEVTEEYIETDKLVYEEACKIEGFIGMESVRQEMGISISYWVDLESIQLWKNNTSHQVAKRKGIEEWYKSYRVRVCKVEKEYGTEVSEVD